MNVTQNMMFATGTKAIERDTIFSMTVDLNRLPLFQDMENERRDMLQKICEPFFSRAGRVVLEQGMPADYLYVILRGKVEISYKPYDGTRITVTHVQKGGLFGWSAVVGSKVYTSTATAINDVEAIRIRGSDLRKMCADNPEAGRDILEHLASAVSARWTDAHEQVKSILTEGMKG